MSTIIDTFAENVISLDTAAKHVSKLSGKKRNRRVILRWANRGVAGVKLATIQIGGEIYTSQEKLNAFLNESRAAKRRQHGLSTANGLRQQQMQAGFSSEAESLRDLGLVADSASYPARNGREVR